MQCKLISIDGHKLKEPIEFDIDDLATNEGESIWFQMTKIPNWSPNYFYGIECNGNIYDIDLHGWSLEAVT